MKKVKKRVFSERQKANSRERRMRLQGTGSGGMQVTKPHLVGRGFGHYPVPPAFEEHPLEDYEVPKYRQDDD